MYNFLVSEVPDAWESATPFAMSASRFLEKSGTECKGISHQEAESLKRLENTECVLVYELKLTQPQHETVRVGTMHNIAATANAVSFEFVERYRTTRDMVKKQSVVLELDKWDLERTYWAVKDGKLPSLRKRPWHGRLTSKQLRAIAVSIILLFTPMLFPEIRVALGLDKRTSSATNAIPNADTSILQSTLSDLADEYDKLLPYQRPSFEDVYVGNKVSWTLRVVSLTFRDQSVRVLLLEEKPRSYTKLFSAFFKVQLSDHPFLKTMREGEVLHVQGKIASVVDQSVELVEVTLRR